MDKDNVLRGKVMEDLEREPSCESDAIDVAVVDGVVTLNSFVKSYAEKRAAEKGVGRVAGANAIAEALKVRYASDPKPGDHEIVRRILDMFAGNSLIPQDTIQVKVQNGWVSLMGKVQWHYQAKEAARVASRISGVTGIFDTLAVANREDVGDLRKKI